MYDTMEEYWKVRCQEANEERYNYINFAENMSYRTCEVCGSPGKRYTDGWHQVLCDAHAKEDGREMLEMEEENGL